MSNKLSKTGLYDVYFWSGEYSEMPMTVYANSKETAMKKADREYRAAGFRDSFAVEAVRVVFPCDSYRADR